MGTVRLPPDIALCSADFQVELGWRRQRMLTPAAEVRSGSELNKKALSAAHNFARTKPD